MNISVFIRTTKKNNSVNVRLRLTDGRNFQRFGVIPNLSVLPEHWDKRKEKVRPARANCNEANDKIDLAKRKIEMAYMSAENKEALPADFIKSVLNETINNVTLNGEKNYIIALFEKYLSESKASQARKKTIFVAMRILERFIILKNIKNVLQINPFELEYFIKNEYGQAEKHPELYNYRQRPRGNNTVIYKIKILNAFFRWAVAKNYLPVNPLPILSLIRKFMATLFVLQNLNLIQYIPLFCQKIYN
jgi:hypothetical protein